MINNNGSNDDIIELSPYQHSPPGSNSPPLNRSNGQHNGNDNDNQSAVMKVVPLLENVMTINNNYSTTPTSSDLSEDDHGTNDNVECIKNSRNKDNDETVSNKMKLLFTLLGMGTLCPYNAIISCIDWFESYLNLNEEDSKNLESQISASCIASLVITTILLLLSKSYNASSFSGINILQSSTNRMYIGFILDIILLSIFALYKPSHAHIVLLSFVIGIADAISQSGVYGIAATIHTQCSAYVSLGSALSGTLISIIRMLCMSLSHDDRTSSMLFFSFIVLLLFGCFYGSTLVSTLETTTASIQEENEQHQPSYARSISLDIEQSNVVQILPSSSPNNTTYTQIFNQVWIILFCMTFNFFITLSLFPGVITSISSIDHFVSDNWIPIILITTFNLFDFIGRIILTDTFGWLYLIHVLVPKNDNKTSIFLYVVFIPCMLRIFFVPLLLYVVPIFSDVITIILVSVLGLSNGFITSACFMVGPSVVPDEYKEDVSLWLLLSLYIGLLLGAFSGMLFF